MNIKDLQKGDTVSYDGRQVTVEYILPENKVAIQGASAQKADASELSDVPLDAVVLKRLGFTFEHNIWSYGGPQERLLLRVPSSDAWPECAAKEGFLFIKDKPWTVKQLLYLRQLQHEAWEYGIELKPARA